MSNLFFSIRKSKKNLLSVRNFLRASFSTKDEKKFGFFQFLSTAATTTTTPTTTPPASVTPRTTSATTTTATTLTTTTHLIHDGGGKSDGHELYYE